MSLRQLVEGDCGGVNPLMQLGGQFTRDVARKDEGFTQTQFERSMRPDEQMVNDFLGQVAAPPQSFQMQTLLQEMREIEQANMGAPQFQVAPPVIDEITNQWTKDFNMNQNISPERMLNLKPQQQQMTYVREFFDSAPNPVSQMIRPYYQPPQPYLAICPPGPLTTSDKFFDGAEDMRDLTIENHLPKEQQINSMEDWINDFETNREGNEQTASNYNEKFWQRLQDEWQKLSEESDHPWLTDFHDGYDLYKHYTFAEKNPMNDLENVFQKGKEYMAKGDIPSAVLCFEAAVNKETDNAEIWEHLGMAQAENEMDPQSIAALTRCLELNPNNGRVLMALAVCYTNESLPNQAIKMLINWLEINPKYKHLVPVSVDNQPEGAAAAAQAFSIMRGSKLKETQNIFLEAARLNPEQIDADIQEALGVLYNLSSDYDKAVDCFRAAVHVNPKNAKTWNRLGASLANGSRSVEAVEAYQNALQLEPGFIRVRYNVGVCCMNLKAYKQAVEHLLAALNMQANTAALRDMPADITSVVKGTELMSESIWITLKMVVSLMGRNDLQGLFEDRNLAGLNEAFKDLGAE